MTPNGPLWPYSTLRAGGNAEHLGVARTVNELAEWVIGAHKSGSRLTVLGGGSNILPSDQGVPGVVIVNRTSGLEIDGNRATVDTGVPFQELFLKTAQEGLGGLEYAVGIPGTVGGALVSDAGDYRSNICESLVELEVVLDGVRSWVGPEVMGFKYRDSVLRSPHPPRLVTLRARFELAKRPRKEIYDEARDYQRQRIGKQPPSASAGSFFKNVESVALAESLERLPETLKRAGVVPAGFLLEACCMKGYRLGGAMFGQRHANFMLNVGGASASEIRLLASLGKTRVYERFGVTLEEEVLYIGDWSAFEPIPG